jgi:hypothetical protein
MVHRRSQWSAAGWSTFGGGTARFSGAVGRQESGLGHRISSGHRAEAILALPRDLLAGVTYDERRI